jgi:AraC-like DNA-binding protein
MSRKPCLKIEDVKSLLDQPFFTKQIATRGPRAVASNLGVSERSFRRRLHDLGTDPRELITSYRIKMLVTMLLADLPCGVISRELGFKAPCTLSRFARKQFGHPPRLLRRLLKTTAHLEATGLPKKVEMFI